jgi:hypothetical protein
MRPKDTWQTLVCVGANTSLWDEILRTAKNTDAQLRRVFEIDVVKRPDTHDKLAVARLIGSLNDNYGRMGEKYAELISTRVDEVDKITYDICEQFNKDVQATSEERFHSAICGTMVAGAALANSLGATFNVNLLYNYLVKEFIRQRDRIVRSTSIGGTSTGAIDTLTKYLQEISESVLWTDTMQVGKGAPVVAVVKKGPPTDQPVFVRCVVDLGKVLMSKDRFREFIKRHQLNEHSSLEALRKHYGMKEGRRDITAGLSYVGGRETTMEFAVTTEGPLYDLLYKQTLAASRPNLPAEGSNTGAPNVP